MLILIAGKQRSLRNALKGFLLTRTSYVVASTVADKEALFIQVKTEPPDFVLLDEDFTELLIEEVIVPLQQIDSRPQLIILGRRSELKPTYLDAGAAAFISKSEPPKTLLTTIEEFRLRDDDVQ